MKNAGHRVRRAALAAAVLLVAAAAAVAALRPRPMPVEVAAVTRGPIRAVVEGTGRTRVRDLFVVAAPVAGHLQCLSVREGDAVRAGEPVATLVPAAPVPLDARTRRELHARATAAAAAEEEARAGVQRARLAAAQAVRDRDRARALAEAGSASRQQAEDAESASATRDRELEMARAGAARAAGEAEAARAALASVEGPGRGERMLLRAPAGGRVLRVARESEGPVAAGAPVVEVGDPATLEVDVELLTSQAVRVAPGARAELVAWGGATPLAGAVARIDPAAFTKVSALGVEEQRVHVVVRPAGGEGWARLGDGFAVEVRVVVSETPDALKVPSSAIFRSGAAWAAFVVDGGRARLRAVRIGEVEGAEASVVDGLRAGERVVLYPSDKLRDGARVKPR